MVGLARQIYFYEKQGNLYQNRGLEEPETEVLRDLREVGGSKPRRRLETDIKVAKNSCYISFCAKRQIGGSGRWSA